jgi:hypothetical protein
MEDSIAKVQLPSEPTMQAEKKKKQRKKRIEKAEKEIGC